MNIIYKINNTNTILYRSSRKIIWFNVPDLKILEKYYTKSTFIHINTSGTIMVVDKNSLSFLTADLPPLQIIQYKKQFLDWQPIGGFCLSMSVVLYDKHSICLFNKGQSLKQSWSIDVVQEIQEIKYSQSESYIGMKVEQKKNTIYLWDLGDVSSKSSQEIIVFGDIIKWQFYLEDMLIIMSNSQIRAYYPSDGKYSLYFYKQMEKPASDFCFLERPKVNKHSGRRLVYPMAVLCDEGQVWFYQLYDMDKRLKNSLASVTSKIKIDPTISKIIGGFENENKEIVLMCQGIKSKPMTFILDEKYFILNKFSYQPEISSTIEAIEYGNGYFGIVEKRGEQESEWKIFRLHQREQSEYIDKISCKNLLIGRQSFYCFNNSNICVFSLPKLEPIYTIQFKCPSKIYLLAQTDKNAYFVAGIKVYKYNGQQKTMKAVSFIIKNERFKLQSVNIFTKSLIYKMGSDNVLMEYRLENDKIIASNVRTTSNQIISLRNGRWAEPLNTSIIFGQSDRSLVTFDLQKFFKSLTQDNILFDYNIHWTTHDGIILVVKNYIFILQIIQNSEGYSLQIIKKMLNYMHHRLDPDAKIIEVINPRQFVVREDNRIIRIGNRINNYVSEDPYALPDTLLQRQLEMRKYYPPHHPKIISYLIQMGQFNFLLKIFKNIMEWTQGNGNIHHLYKRIGIQFYEEYFREKTEEQFIQVAEEEGQQIEKLNKLCEMILEEPHKLQLEENGALVLQSQIESMIYRQQNTRSMDYYSSIVLMQHRLPSKKNKPFKSLQIAYLLHSINKDQALSILKPEKMQWGWMQKYSIVYWYDGKEQIKKWIEEIGANEYRKDREPFDCLLWYTLVGKKNLLVTLFKTHQFNSKEHAAIFTFLQRDFNEPKNQSAAVKNAYVLIDKKRYLHALAFFIYGNKFEEALSLCLTKIKDINLAMLICIMCNYEKTKIFEVLENDGDIWMKHISLFLKGKHIRSFNCLFQTPLSENWNYLVQLSGFRPCAKPFAQMIEKSIPVRRQLEQQSYNKIQSQSNDIFDSFYQTGTKEQQKMQQNVQQDQLESKYEDLKAHTIDFYIRNNCPLLALMIEKNNIRAKRAHSLEQFMLTKKIKEEVYELAQEMEDIISILLTKLQNQQSGIEQLLHNFYSGIIKTIKELSLDAVVKKDKCKVGKLLHLCYHCEKIINIKDNFVREQEKKIVEKDMPFVKLLGQILLCLQLNLYELLPHKLKTIRQLILREDMQVKEQEIFEDGKGKEWDLFKRYYGKLSTLQQQKNKSQKLLDTFQYSLYRYNYRRNKENAYENQDPKLEIHESTILKFNCEVLTLIINALILKEENKQIIQILEEINKKLFPNGSRKKLAPIQIDSLQ